MSDLIQYTFNGLVVGSIFAIAAVGISLLYSVLRIRRISHILSKRNAGVKFFLLHSCFNVGGNGD